MRKLLTTVLGLTVLSLGLDARFASADTLSAAFGMQSNDGRACFLWGDSASGEIGLFKSADSSCDFQHYVLPLYWRNFYSASTNRTVRVRGKLNSSGAFMGCTLHVVNSSGTITSQAGANFTTVGSYSTLTLVVNNVTSTSSSFLSCGMSEENTKLLMVDYSP